MAIDYSNSPPWLREWLESRFYTEPAPEPLLPTDQSVVLGRTPRYYSWGDSELSSLANRNELFGGAGDDTLSKIGSGINSFIDDVVGIFNSESPDKDDAKDNAAAGKGLAPVSLQAPGETYQLPGGQVSYYQNSDGTWTAVNNITKSIMPDVSPPGWEASRSSAVEHGLTPTEAMFAGNYAPVNLNDTITIDPFTTYSLDNTSSLSLGLDNKQPYVDPFDTFDFRGRIGGSTWGPPGLQGLMDPTMSTMDKWGALGHLVTGGVASMAIPGAGVLGLLGSVLNAAGGFHSFNPKYDSNLTYDPASGRISWDTLSPGGRGQQYGPKNNYNTMRDMDPNQMVGMKGPNGDIVGWAKAGDLTEHLAQIETWNKYGDDYATIDDLNVTTDREFANQPFDLTIDDEISSTNFQALQQFNLDGTGSIMNTAGFLAGKNAGYEKTSQIANEIAANVAAGMSPGLTGWTYSPGSGTMGKGQEEGGGLGGWADWSGKDPDGEDFDWGGAMYDSWGESEDESYDSYF
jgi:hypothetical protein